MNRPSEAALLRAHGYNDETGICFCVSDTQRCQSCLELGAVLDKFSAQARLAFAEKHLEHNDTYEGSCGVHMPSHCDKCCIIATLQQQAGEQP